MGRQWERTYQSHNAIRISGMRTNKRCDIGNAKAGLPRSPRHPATKVNHEAMSLKAGG